MPTYEMPVLFRLMSRPELVSAVRRTADVLFSKGAVIRKIESMGQKAMPYKTSAHGSVHREANYFLISFDAPPTTISDLNEEYGRDIDIVRRRIYKQNDDPPEPCTLAQDLLPAPYRPHVQKMLEMSKRKQKPGFQFNTGLDYNPFQK